MLNGPENNSSILRIHADGLEVHSLDLGHGKLRFVKQQKEHTTIRNSASQKDNLVLIEKIFPELKGHADALVYDEFGKPWPGNRAGFVSISHSARWFAVSFSDSHVQGIDIEQLRPKLATIEKRFLHPSESEWLSIQPDKQTALQIFWGAKEAMYKAFGRKKLQFNRDIRVSEFNYRKPSVFAGYVDSPEGVLHFEIAWLKPDDESYLVIITNNSSNPILPR
jgi:phosphopantetheine--protein transferase-like protein